MRHRDHQTTTAPDVASPPAHRTASDLGRSTIGPAAQPRLDRCLVVVPTYNEAQNIDVLLDRLVRSAPGIEVLVVDDGSPDGTGEHVRRHPAHDRRVHLLDGSSKRGLGAAYRRGFAWALAHDFDVIVQMDADLSHPPELVPALVTALQDADVAVASRYVDGGDVSGWTPVRRYISRIGNFYARTLLSLQTLDATAGFKAWRAEALRLCTILDTTSDGYSFQLEAAWLGSRAGLRLVDVPVTFVDRRLGQSKMSARIITEALWRVAHWRLAELRGRRLGGALR